jgi:hypothetical protein
VVTGKTTAARGRPRTAPDLGKRANPALENHIKLADRRWTTAETLTVFVKEHVLQSRESWNERTLHDSQFTKDTTL